MILSHDFSLTLTTLALDQSSLRWFEACSCKPAPRGLPSSSTQLHYIEQVLLAHYIAEILLNIDDQHISEAEHWIQKAIEADQRNRTMFQLGSDYALYADLFKRKGDRSKAQENLGKAMEILKECGAEGWVEKYEKELTALL